MNRETMDRVMKGLLTASFFAIFMGAMFKLQHWPYGIEILKVGIGACIIISYIEIRRLRKIISDSENKSEFSQLGK